MRDWSVPQLELLDRAQELRIATPRADGALRPAVPIWVVLVDGRVFIRTWHRRTTGWYGHAVDGGRARIEVPGLAADVAVVDVGAEDGVLRAAIDEAYHRKYGGGGGVTTAEAAGSTLRLDPWT